MSRFATALLPVLSLVLILSPLSASHAGSLGAGANCAGGNAVTVGWNWTEYPQLPTGPHPEWVGYDVLRRSVKTCDAFVRVNAQPFVRTPGISQSFTYTETPPATGVLYEYRIILVDAGRNEVVIGASDCDCAGRDARVSCPEYSAPVTQGTLSDWGWTLVVSSCPGSCYPSCIYGEMGNALYDELRPFAGTGTVLRFYGAVFCCTLEGPVLSIDHYDVAPCETVVPVRTATWGRVKALYR